MKSAIGLSIGFLLGFACRYFDIPVPSPPKLLGAFLVVAVTVGYMAADRILTKPAPKPTLIQTLRSSEREPVNR
jgi:XapX domain-containing protein